MGEARRFPQCPQVPVYACGGTRLRYRGEEPRSQYLRGRPIVARPCRACVQAGQERL